MKWMSTLLTKNNFKILYDIGDDAPNIFFEIWYTSANSTIRTQAKGIAKTLTEKLEEKLLKRAEVSRDAFFEAGWYKLNPLHPSLESAWFQPLNLKCDLLGFKVCFQIQLHHLLRGDVHAADKERDGAGLRGAAGALR
jgi:hypothetical protein